jgi:hypothetical protein
MPDGHEKVIFRYNQIPNSTISSKNNPLIFHISEMEGNSAFYPSQVQSPGRDF